MAPETKMMSRTAAQEQARPQQTYKRELLSRIAATSPKSLLDIGCGEGALLRAVAGLGCADCVGLEIDETVIASRQAVGLNVHLGRAEALPFEDKSFDVVVFDDVAHHVEYLPQALTEAARVACRSILVLDPWYDVAIASQQVARDFDLWTKMIDRRLGLVHNPNPSAAELALPLLAIGGFQIVYDYRLILQPVPLAKIEATARAQLALIDNDPLLTSNFDALMDQARLHGFSDDGALLFSATRG
jgi:SAM-dependent methyltransferase